MSQQRIKLIKGTIHHYRRQILISMRSIIKKLENKEIDHVLILRHTALVIAIGYQEYDTAWEIWLYENKVS